MLLRVMHMCVPLALASCASKHESPVRGVTIAFSGFGCETGCPDYVISVDSTLVVSYYGGPSAQRHGYFQGAVTAAQWDSVQQRFEGFLIQGIDTTSSARTDHPDFEMVIAGKERNLHIDNNTGNLTDSDRATVHSLMSLVDRAAEIRTVDSIAFPTSAQYRYQEMIDDYRRRSSKDPFEGVRRIDSTSQRSPRS